MPSELLTLPRLLAITATLLSPTLSQVISKPAIHPKTEDWSAKFKPEFKNKWPAHKPKVTPWNDIPDRRDLIPVACTGQFDKWWLVNTKPEDFNVYDVYYDDCDKPWQLCFHKGIQPDQITLDTAVESWGRVPVSMRQWAANIVVIPPGFTDNNGVAHQIGVALVFQTDAISSPTINAHELSHSLDNLKLGNGGSFYYSQQAEWIDTVAKDAAVVTDHARTDYREALAEIGVLAAYDAATSATLPGDLLKLEPRLGEVQNQFDRFKAKLGGDVVAGGKSCPNKQASTQTVKKSSGVGKFRKFRRAETVVQPQGFDYVDVSGMEFKPSECSFGVGHDHGNLTARWH